MVANPGKWLNIKIAAAHRAALLRGAVLLALAMTGCRREQIEVYSVPKETENQDVQMGHQSAPATGQPAVTWSLPSGWEERAGDAQKMRVASFAVPNKSGPEGDVGIIPLPNMDGKELDIANIWRDQVKAAPFTEDEYAKEVQKVPIGSQEGTFLDIAGTKPVLGDSADKSETPTPKYPMRIMVAKLTQGDTTFFIKLAGESTFVEQQKPDFLQFLKSISIKATAAPMTNPHGATGGAIASAPLAEGDPGDLPNWTPPATWKQAPPSQMLLAKFVVPGAGSTKAEVNISSLGGDGGGTLANVNRWRRQLKLGETDEAGLPKLITPLDVPGGKAMLVDMNGTGKAGEPARLVAVIVPQSGQTWFYKLMGDTSVVEKEKAAFQQFVQTVKYTHAP